MIDVSNYELVGIYCDKGLQWYESRDISAVYMLTFGDDFYIGSADYVYMRVKEHVSCFLRHCHTEKMQSAFDSKGTFDIYVLERGIQNDDLIKREIFYIKDLNPTLNKIYAINEKSWIRNIIELKIAQAGMTKKEFAAKMGAHAGSLNSMLEAPSWPTLERVAKALGCDVPQLFSDASSSAIICPKCGHEIKIKVEQ